MHWVEKPGTSLEAMTPHHAARQPGAARDPRRAQLRRRTSAAPRSPTRWSARTSPSSGSASIPTVDYDADGGTIQTVVDGYPGLYRDLLTYLRERIKEVLTGASATIVVRIFGPDLDVLRAQGRRGRQGDRRRSTASPTSRSSRRSLVPQIEVRLRPDARGALRPDARRRSPRRSRRCCEGRKVGEVYDEQKIFDVVVWGMPAAARATCPRCGGSRSRRPGAGTCRWATSPTCRVVPTPNEITREGASRRIDVTCNVRGRDLGASRATSRRRVAAAAVRRRLPPGVPRRVRRARRRRSSRLLALGALSLLGHPARAATSTSARRGWPRWSSSRLPFALIGGVAGGALSAAACSRSARWSASSPCSASRRATASCWSATTAISSTRRAMPFGRELVLRGAEERLAPILMTALATGPGAGAARRWAAIAPGHEIEHPMAVVILGGLVHLDAAQPVPAALDLPAPRAVEREPSAAVGPRLLIEDAHPVSVLRAHRSSRRP